MKNHPIAKYTLTLIIKIFAGILEWRDLFLYKFYV